MPPVAGVGGAAVFVAPGGGDAFTVLMIGERSAGGTDSGLMFLAGGDYWVNWYPAIRDQLIARQGSDGSWQGDVSPEYATSMALIILQMPNRYLPVFNGKGPGS